MSWDLRDYRTTFGLRHCPMGSLRRAPNVIVVVRRGSEPVASMALHGATMPDSVLQGVANLVAIGLERARAQDLAQEIEAARQSEQLRTTLIDAMAHEFKTPLTLIKAATTSLLAYPDVPRKAGRNSLRSRTRRQNTCGS